MRRSILHRFWTSACNNFLPDLLFLGIVSLLSLLGVLMYLYVIWRVRIERFGPAAIFAVEPPFLPQIFQPVLDTLVSLSQGIEFWLDRQASILTFTDPAATYNSPSVIDIWRLILIFADSLLAIFVVLAGYQILFGGFSPRYAEALEELPRLLFAGIGANISLLFARFWIDLNDLICGVLFFQATSHLFPVFVLVAVLNILALPLFALLVLLMLLLGIQMAVRLGIILLLLVCLPILFLLLASRHTRHIGQAGLTSYVVVVMVQSLQILTLTLGVRVLVPFLELNINPSTTLAPLATLLSGIVLLWLVLRIPGMLRHWALQPIAETSQEAHRRIIIATSKALKLALM